MTIGISRHRRRRTTATIAGRQLSLGTQIPAQAREGVPRGGVGGADVLETGAGVFTGA